MTQVTLANVLGLRKVFELMRRMILCVGVIEPWYGNFSWNTEKSKNELHFKWNHGRRGKFN